MREMQQKLIGTLAHDIRNPLSVALTATELQSYDEGQEVVERLKSMAFNNINRELKMIEVLLEDISVNAGEGMMFNFSKMDVIPFIRMVYEEVCEIYSEDFVFTCEVDSVTGVFDGTAIRRVLENLLSNALKYGDTGRPITIGVDETEEYLILRVHNFGPAIKNPQEIFNFLTRTEGEDRGNKLPSWGMGLTLVKMVVDAHGGEIELSSTTDAGTEFKLWLSKFSNTSGKVRSRLNYKL